jgi:hypothetical protein
MRTTLLALTAAFVLCGCPDPKVPKLPPQVPEPKAVQLTQKTGQSWIVERAPVGMPWAP